ncbi:Hypothetical predicted protein [Octopus vulgaris]|uniref:Uncharacterized protein n=1 Tax=Octopus vulgaris TaxID=6645 RepID=A0AA36AVB0_OCTVU|nr:Hypothetical predicted protein [Octopus vulgaris]
MSKRGGFHSVIPKSILAFCPGSTTEHCCGKSHLHTVPPYPEEQGICICDTQAFSESIHDKESECINVKKIKSKDSVLDL